MQQLPVSGECTTDPAQAAQVPDSASTGTSLATGEKGFFLMVEGARIDHASHANHLRNAVLETLEFDNAVEEVLRWAAGRDDALVLVAADHECGGLTVVESRGLGEMPEVTWASGGHTKAPVPLFAWGVGADRFAGKLDNTDVPKRIPKLPESDPNVDQSAVTRAEFRLTQRTARRFSLHRRFPLQGRHPVGSEPIYRHHRRDERYGQPAEGTASAKQWHTLNRRFPGRLPQNRLNRRGWAANPPCGVVRGGDSRPERGYFVDTRSGRWLQSN